MTGQNQFVVRRIQKQGFHTRLARYTLGNANQRQIMDSQLLQHITRHVHLALAAIDQQDIRHLALTVLDPRETAHQSLMHCRIVVACGNTFDIEAAVVALDRPLGPKHHTGSDRRLTAGVADVVTLQPRRHVVKLQRLLQGFKSLLDMLTVAQEAGQ